MIHCSSALLAIGKPFDLRDNNVENSAEKVAQNLTLQGISVSSVLCVCTYCSYSPQ